MQTLNLGILAHVDAGKTSLTERLLFDNSVISRLGSVDVGDTQTDSGDLERQRGITIRSAVAPFAVGGLQVNLVDTPGHPDFIAEVERALAVLDGAVLVLSAVEGVQAQTRVLMKSLVRLGLPTLIFINKIDRRGARCDDLLADIRGKLTPGLAVLNTVTELGTRAAATAPVPLTEPAARGALAEVLAERDDDLLGRLIDGTIPDRREIESLLARQTAAGLLHPVFFGSALSGAGVAELCAAIGPLLRPQAGPDPGADASPTATPSTGTPRTGAPRTGAARTGAAATHEPGARGTVFAIERGDRGEKVAYLRLFSGELRERQRVRLARREPGGRIRELTGQITGLDIVGSQLAGHRGRGPLTAGEIGKVRGLAEVRVGDQLIRAGDRLIRVDESASGAGSLALADGPAFFPPPSLETIVRPRHPRQAALLHSALMSLADEDPLIQARPAGGGATSVLLYGAVQREVIEARLLAEFGVAAVFEQLQAVYFERPAGTGEVVEQIGDGLNPFLATVGLRVEPAPRGAGVSFAREVELGSLPRAFHRAIEDTVTSTLEQGLHGWTVTDCAVTLIHCGFAPPVSVAADFRQLTPLVLMRALEAAGTRVYEPCHAFEVDIPADTVSHVTAQLAGLGANITSSQATGPATAAAIPAPAGGAAAGAAAEAPTLAGAPAAPASAAALAGSAADTAFWLIAGQIPARLIQDFLLALPGLSRGAGSWWSHPSGDRLTRRGQVPRRERRDGNPLNRDEYLRFLTGHGRP